MNDIIKDTLRQIADNDNLMKALDICFSEIWNQKDFNLELNNEDLGAETRARLRAKELVEKGLNKIKELKTNRVDKKKENYI